MNPEFSDELISAYLDGELSAEEQKQVENALLDSAEHRRTFEELRALRRSLQSLPAERLDEGFAERVLRRAEREMLAPRAAAVDEGAIQPVATDEGGVTEREVVPLSCAASPSMADRGVPMRRWVALVTAGAMAASLLIAVLVVPRWLQPEVARGPETAPATDPTSSPQGSGTGEFPVENATVDTKARAGGEFQGKSAGAAVYAAQDLKDNGAKELKGAPIGGGIAGADFADQIDASQPNESANNAQGAFREQHLADRDDARALGGGGFGGRGSQYRPAQEGAADRSPGAAARYAPANSLSGGSGGYGAPGGSGDALTRQLGGAEVGGETQRRSLLVVTVDVTSEAYASGAIEELLYTNNIVMEQTAPDAQLAARESGRDEAVRDRAATSDREATRRVAEADAVQADAVPVDAGPVDAVQVAPDDAREVLDQFERQAVRPYDVEMVEVEAPRELVQAAIDDLRRQPDKYQNVELRSANEREIRLLLAATATEPGERADKQRGFADSESAEAPLTDGAALQLADSPAPSAIGAAGPSSAGRSSSGVESAPAPRARLAQSGSGGRGDRNEDQAREESADAPPLPAEPHSQSRGDDKRFGGDRRGGGPESLKKEADEERGNASAPNRQSLDEAASHKAASDEPALDDPAAATTGSAGGVNRDPLQRGRARRLYSVRVPQTVDGAYLPKGGQFDKDGELEAASAVDRPAASPAPSATLESDGTKPPGLPAPPADEDDGTSRRKSDEPRVEKALAEGNVSPAQAEAAVSAGGQRIGDVGGELESNAPHRLNVLFVIRIQSPAQGVGAATEASKEADGAALDTAPASESPDGNQQP